MDLDSFLALPKWDILKIISNKPSSPIEIAEITKTTVSYVSQQLKLLEAYGVIQKTKTGAFEKGKPRNVFSLSEEFVYFSVLSNGFSIKKKIILDSRRLVYFRIWSLDNLSFHLPLEMFFFEVNALLSDIEVVCIDLLKLDEINLIVVSDKKGIRGELSQCIKKINGKINLRLLLRDEFLKESKDSLFLLYDSKNILKNEELKGGILEKNEI